MGYPIRVAGSEITAQPLFTFQLRGLDCQIVVREDNVILLSLNQPWPPLKLNLPVPVPYRPGKDSTALEFRLRRKTKSRVVIEVFIEEITTFFSAEYDDYYGEYPLKTEIKELTVTFNLAKGFCCHICKIS